MSMNEFADILAISQMTPGPVAVNLATFTGFRCAGIPGAVVATVAFVLPSFIITSVLAILYRKYSELKVVKNTLEGLRPASIGLILSAGLSIVVLCLFGAEGFNFSDYSLEYISAGLFAVSFVAMRLLKKVPPIAVIALCGAVGGVLHTVIPG